MFEIPILYDIHNNYERASFKIDGIMDIRKIVGEQNVTWIVPYSLTDFLTLKNRKRNFTHQ